MGSDAASTSRYRVLDTIGRGGMGEVCLAEDAMLHRNVALKFLASSPEEGGQALQQLLMEARAAAALDHPFICKIYEVTTLDGRPCIAMEYVRGETLERRLRRGALPLAEALRVGEEVAEALEAAHKRRLVHRDLKPANVMITDDGHVKVMDFGLAVRAAHPSPAQDGRVRPTGDLSTVRGTPAYMSPEQFTSRVVDHRSDIFAFGVVLYQSLSGVHPFLSLGLDATMRAILAETPRDLADLAPGVPKALAATVARMLAKDPVERHASFGEVRRDLRRMGHAMAPPPTPAPTLVDAPPTPTRAPFVGRAAALADLVRACRQATTGSGAMVLIRGEAGIGKSRLAEEAILAARGSGCLALRGRCGEQRDMPPLVPYLEVLEDAARLLPAGVFREVVRPQAPELARLTPELLRMFPDLPPSLELPPELRQRFLFTNVRDFLSRCGRVAPLVILLDDLQWADESTLRLTQYLAQQLPQLPATLIAIYRDLDAPVEREPAGRLERILHRVRSGTPGPSRRNVLRETVEQLIGQRLAREIALGPLSEDDVAGLLGALGSREAPAAVARTFADATGGNPFFVEELFRHVNEEGRLFDGEGAWRADVEIHPANVPEGIRTVITRRLQRLPDNVREVLTAAASIGRRFDLDLLERVAGVDEATLVAAVEEAERLHLVTGPAGRTQDRWQFAHQLICNTLTGALSRARRERLHLRIAEAMTQLDPDSRAFIADIAHHLYAAGRASNPAGTARALVAAGRAADSVYATQEAIAQYRRALEVLDLVRGAEKDRLLIRERLADLLTLAGAREEALAHYTALADTFERQRAPIDQGRTVRKIGNLHWQSGKRQDATACYTRALGLLDGSGAHLELAELHQQIGLAAFRSGDSTAAIEWAERALASAEAARAAPSSAAAAGERAVAAAMAHATNTIGVALARSGALDAARQRIERSVAIARDHGLLDVACRGYSNLGVIYCALEPSRAIEVSRTGLELAKQIGAASLQPYIYANLATAYCALTDRCEAEGLEAAEAAATLDRDLGQLDHLAVPLIVTAQIYQCKGELTVAQERYQEALALAEHTGEPQLLFPCYDGLATIHLDRGDRVRAEQYLERARDVCQRAAVDPDTLVILPFLS
jgi:adenylate cyclase